MMSGVVALYVCVSAPAAHLILPMRMRQGCLRQMIQGCPKLCNNDRALEGGGGV